jgi:hypothetical protein
MSVLAVPAQPRENRLLAALPDDDYERLLPQLAYVSFALGEVVYEFGGQLDYVYFFLLQMRLGSLCVYLVSQLHLRTMVGEFYELVT